jgi:ElaB/YqjD/DUF883 family membrane-anchored ribosome-binding protein
LNTAQQFQQLISEVEELLERLDDEHGPQLSQLLAQVEKTMSQAKIALTQQAKSAASQIRQYVGRTDGYVRRHPRTVFASGILIGTLLGFLVASARSSD